MSFNPTDSLFPGSDIDPNIESVTLGYDDFCDGEATALLQSLPRQSVGAIIHFTFDGPMDAVGQVSHILGLVEGLDNVDPERKSVEAVTLAKDEIGISRVLIEALRDYPRLPMLGRLRKPGESPDAARIGWCVVEIRQDEKNDALVYLPTVDVAEEYLVNPVTNAARYKEATLAFMNDVIFRHSTSFSRG